MRTSRIALGLVLLTAACGETGMSAVAEDTAAVTSCSEKVDVDALIAKAASGSPELAERFHCLTDDDQRQVLIDGSLELEESELDLSADGELASRLTHIVDEEARVWWDTILEGPYSLEGEAEIRWVEELRLSGKRVALRITFGAPAVMTESCDPSMDEENTKTKSNGWPESCTRGTISQTIYVDAELDRMIAMDEPADFFD